MSELSKDADRLRQAHVMVARAAEQLFKDMNANTLDISAGYVNAITHYLEAPLEEWQQASLPFTKDWALLIDTH